MVQNTCKKIIASSVIHDIIQRQVTIHRIKMEQIEGLRNYFKDSAKKDSTLKLKVIRELLRNQLDEFESERLMDELEQLPEKSLSFADFSCAIKALLE